MLALNFVERPLGSHGVYALLGLVHNEQIELQLAHPPQLVVLSAKVDRTLQSLQRFKRNHALGRVISLTPHHGHIVVPGQDTGAASERVRIGHKGKFTPPADEFKEIIRPGVGDAGAVGNDQHLGKAHLPDQVVGGQRLPKPRLGVPQKLLAALFKVGLGHSHGLLLLLPQRIGQLLAICWDKLPPGKPVKIAVGGGAVHMEPLCARRALDAQGRFQKGVKFPVSKILPGAVLVHGVVLPGQDMTDIRRVGLLFHPLGRRLLLCVADFCPAVVVDNARCVVGVDHGHDPFERLYLDCHHAISFTWDSINWISFSSRPYFL